MVVGSVENTYNSSGIRTKKYYFDTVNDKAYNVNYVVDGSRIVSATYINDFIEQNTRQYAIPAYQRNYEWSKVRCVKLFEDIVLAFKNDRTRFCGSAVYAPFKEEHNIHYYVIIDAYKYHDPTADSKNVMCK